MPHSIKIINGFGGYCDQPDHESDNTLVKAGKLTDVTILRIRISEARLTESLSRPRTESSSRAMTLSSLGSEKMPAPLVEFNIPVAQNSSVS